MEASGDPIADHDLVIIVISSLTEDFNSLITALETIAEDNLTWDYLRDCLSHEAEKMKDAVSKERVKDALFTNKSRKVGRDKKPKEFICHYCRGKNKFARYCTKTK